MPNLQRLSNLANQVAVVGVGETDYPAIKRILEADLDAAPLTEPASAPGSPRYAFVRQVGDFVSSLVGGVR